MDEMKICPFCGKEILSVAKMCKYCREWLPEETASTTKPVETKKTAETEETVNTEKHTKEETVQTPILSKEERDARLKELSKEINRLRFFEKPRAQKEGLDVSEINNKIEILSKEESRLDLEKGLEEGYYYYDENGRVIVNREIDGPAYHPYRPFVLIGATIIAIIIVVVLIVR